MSTEDLAIYGAITGTIGMLTGLFNLYIRYSQHKQDSAKLICTSEFNYSSPYHENFTIIARSIAKRPISLDSIKYYARPPMLKRLFKSYFHNKGQYIYEQSLKNDELTEGKKKVLKIELPEGLKTSDIYRVEVIDQLNRKWKVEWPSHKVLKQIATMEILIEYNKSHNNKTVKINGYRIGNKYYISASSHKQTSATSTVLNVTLPNF